MAERGIRPISHYVHFPDDSVERALDLDHDAFYRRLVQDEDLPTTSPPTVEDFLAVYEPLVAKGKNVVSVHISSGLSETCNVARQAAARLEQEGEGRKRVEVVDAATTSSALGLLVLAAAAGAAEGESAPEVVERIGRARLSLRNWFVLDTLEFARRGGRIGAATAWLGSRLQVKPILTIEWELNTVERVRTAERAFERLVDYARRLHTSGQDAWAVQHTQAPETAARLVERGEQIFGCPPAFVAETGPVIGIYTGPGLLAISGLDPQYLT